MARAIGGICINGDGRKICSRGVQCTSAHSVIDLDAYGKIHYGGEESLFSYILQA